MRFLGEKMPLPEYINCDSKYIVSCEFYMHDDCPSTCGFALDVGGVGVGGPMVDPTRHSNKDITDSFGNKKIHNGLSNPSYQPDKK